MNTKRKENTVKQNTTTKAPTTFADLIKAYNSDPTSETALIDLATATANAVLKKIAKTSADPTVQNLRRELTRDRADLDRLAYANNGATRITFDTDGDLKTEVIDQQLATAAAKLIDLSLGDGLDLVNDAVCVILEETEKQLERDHDMPIDLERAYTVRRLKRKVWIKTEDSVKGWETVETTPIQEVYKAVCRSVEEQRHDRPNRNGYTYLEDLAVDAESGNETEIYRRLPKYADLGGHVCDFNGKETVPTTADSETVKDVDRLVAALNLSDQQATILKYRLCGYGKKAIATKLGIREDNVKVQIKRVQAKAEEIGLTDK